MNPSMIGLDIAKSVFQVHREEAGAVVEERQLRRGQVLKYFARCAPSLVGLEACGSSHYWARALRELGHEVRLIPAAYVKPFVRRNKTDARDAAAICAALKQPDMRFVRIKSVEQQAARSLERSRDLLVRQRTQLSNSLRSQLSEFGLVARPGRRGFEELLGRLTGELPGELVATLRVLESMITQLSAAIERLEERIRAAAQSDAQMRRLMTIPGIGPLAAHAIVAAAGDGRHFASARDFAAWTGLTPLQHSSADKRRDRGISRQGDSRLRQLLTLGASTLLRLARTHPGRATAWQHGILARRPVKVAVVAQAAKLARIAWAVLTSGTPYRAPRPETA